MACPLPFRLVTCCFGLLLGSCCANNVCDCQGEQQADAITLRFKTGRDTLAGGQSFGKQDLDTVVIKRLPLKATPATKPEVVTLIRALAPGDTLVLNNNTPFPQVGTTKLSGYQYVIQYLVQAPDSKPTPTTVFVIDSVYLQGRFEGSGCCTCYTNSEKKVKCRKNEGVSIAQGSTFDLKKGESILITK